MLRIAIPKGSLEEGTFRLFKNADIPILRKSNRDYNLRIDDPRVEEALLLRPQEIPRYISEGEFDLGITGYDWICETESVVQEVADLRFSKQSWSKVRIILATDGNNPVEKPEDIPVNSRIVTEYPRLTRRFFRKLGKAKVSIRLSYGATEVKVPRLADYFVDITETGETIRKNNNKIIATILTSSTKLIANKEAWNNPQKRQAIEEIALLLTGTIEAMDKALIKMNIPAEKLDELIRYLPALRPPTINAVYFGAYKGDIKSGEWKMVETVVKKSELNIILPEIRKIGASDILEMAIAKKLS